MFLRILSAVVLVTTAGCSGCKQEQATNVLDAGSKEGWPAQLFFGDLGPIDAKLRKQSTEGVPSGYDLQSPDVEKVHYDQPGPTAHGAARGTDVYWVKKASVFFLHSQCDGHHVDGFLGPFEGDPREVLNPPSARLK